jgi:RHH-type rel operon transcriptional repressor/antitoxin RelB
VTTVTVNVRLDKELEKAVLALAHREGITKSDLIRRCLREFLMRQSRARSPWEIGKDLFGKYGSGRSDLSTNRKRIMREKIYAKKGHHRLGSHRRSLRQG